VETNLTCKITFVFCSNVSKHFFYLEGRSPCNPPQRKDYIQYYTENSQFMNKKKVHPKQDYCSIMDTDDQLIQENLHQGNPDHEQEEGARQARSYECIFCKRGFSNAQALGGHT